MPNIDRLLDKDPKKAKDQLKSVTFELEKKYINARRRERYHEVQMPADCFALEVEAQSDCHEHRGQSNDLQCRLCKKDFPTLWKLK